METLASFMCPVVRSGYLKTILVYDMDSNQYIVWDQNIHDAFAAKRKYGGCYQGSYFRVESYEDEQEAMVAAYSEFHRRLTRDVRFAGGTTDVDV